MSLTTTFLTKVTIAEHGGLVRQIVGKLHGASISNEMFTQRLSDVDSTSQAEDDAYTHSQKDFNSNRLKEEDGIVDKLVKAVRAIFNGYAELPEDEPNRQKGIELSQVFKDYNFSPSDTYTAEAEKIRNMNQVFQARIADLQALGVCRPSGSRRCRLLGKGRYARCKHGATALTAFRRHCRTRGRRGEDSTRQHRQCHQGNVRTAGSHEGDDAISRTRQPHLSA